MLEVPARLSIDAKLQVGSDGSFDGTLVLNGLVPFLALGIEFLFELGASAIGELDLLHGVLFHPVLELGMSVLFALLG